MDNLDIIQLIGSNGAAVAFTLYLLYQMRNDRADAIRREIERSEELREDQKAQMALQRETVESVARLERQVHEFKTLLQMWVLEKSRPRNHGAGGGQDAN